MELVEVDLPKRNAELLDELVDVGLYSNRPEAIEEAVRDRTDSLDSVKDNPEVIEEIIGRYLDGVGSLEKVVDYAGWERAKEAYKEKHGETDSGS